MNATSQSDVLNAVPQVSHLNFACSLLGPYRQIIVMPTPTSRSKAGQRATAASSSAHRSSQRYARTAGTMATAVINAIAMINARMCAKG